MAHKDSNVQCTFALLAQHIAEKFGATVEIDWERSMMNFQGELDFREWDKLIAELDKLAERMGVKNVTI